MRKTKICFVGLYCYPLFNEKSDGLFGGSEVRCWLLGKGLAEFPQNDVSFIVFDHGQRRVERYGRIVVHQHSFYEYQDTPLPGSRKAVLKDLSLRLARRIWREGKTAYGKVKSYGRKRVLDIEPQKLEIYRAIDADVYCIFGVSNLAAEVAAYCETAGKRFVLFAGSDQDFSSTYQACSDELNLYGSVADRCYYAIMQADLVISQTRKQADLLRERFGKDSIVTGSGIDLFRGATSRRARTEQQKRVALWIGKSDRVKRPDILVRLARDFPRIQFKMVLNRADPVVFNDVGRNLPPNVELMERIPFRAVEELFQSALVLINTSEFEGLPYTFLQAGKYGIPVLSLRVDPDGFIEQHNCGFVASGDYGNLANGLSLILDEARASQYSQNISRYVASRHNLEDKVREVNESIKKISVVGIENLV